MSEEAQDSADEIRLESALQTIKDVIWRFEDACEGRRSVYDIMGYLVEDLVKEGVCGACIRETVQDVFDAAGIDPVKHRDDGSVYH